MAYSRMEKRNLVKAAQKAVKEGKAAGIWPKSGEVRFSTGYVFDVSQTEEIAQTEEVAA